MYSKDINNSIIPKKDKYNRQLSDVLKIGV